MKVIKYSGLSIPHFSELFKEDSSEEFQLYYWTSSSAIYLNTEKFLLTPINNFKDITKNKLKNFFDLRKFPRDSIYFTFFRIPKKYQVIYENCLQKDLILSIFDNQKNNFEGDFLSVLQKNTFSDNTCLKKIQFKKKGVFAQGYTLSFYKEGISGYPAFTERPEVSLTSFSEIQDLFLQIEKYLMSYQNEKNVNIIYLDSSHDAKFFLDRLSSLTASFIKIQLSDDFQDNNLICQVYSALKKKEVTVLLTIPSLECLKQLEVRQFDGIFLDAERNRNELFELLKYCSEKNLRTVLRVTKDQDLSLAASLQLYYPSLPIFIRTDSIDYSLAVTFFKEKCLYLDLPLCLTNEGFFPTSLKALNDVIAFLDPSGVYPADISLFLKAYQKKKSACLNCACFSDCMGYLKENTQIKDIVQCQTTGFPFESVSIAKRVQDIKPVDSQVIQFDPENYQLTAGANGVAAIQQMQKTRLEKKFSGKNFYYIWDFLHSCYFNRPLEKTELFQKDPRGLMSLNWQFLGIDNPDMLWKQKCDLLLPHHGFTITTQITFDKYWSPDDQQALDKLTLDTLQFLILQAGGDKEKLQQVGNDLLYDNKKFCGKEWLFVPDVGYIENTVVTCQYQPEKKWFEQLYHHPKEKVITGITEEVPACTKEYLMWGLHYYCNKFFRGF